MRLLVGGETRLEVLAASRRGVLNAALMSSASPGLRLLAVCRAGVLAVVAGGGAG